MIFHFSSSNFAAFQIVMIYCLCVFMTSLRFTVDQVKPDIRRHHLDSGRLHRVFLINFWHLAQKKKSNQYRKLQLEVQGNHLCVRPLCRIGSIIESTWLVSLSAITPTPFSEVTPWFSQRFADRQPAVCLPPPHLTHPLALSPGLHSASTTRSHLFMLLPGLAVLGVGGRVPRRGQRTDVAYIMISKSVISAALILLASPPYISLWLARLAVPSFTVPCQVREPRARCSFPPLVRASESMGSVGRRLQLPWKAIINICQWGGQ